MLRGWGGGEVGGWGTNRESRHKKPCGPFEDQGRDSGFFRAGMTGPWVMCDWGETDLLLGNPEQVVKDADDKKQDKERVQDKP